MSFITIVLNEREAKDARARIAEIDELMTSENLFQAIVQGIPSNVLLLFRKAMDSHRKELLAMVTSFEEARRGEGESLLKRVGNNPGLALIAARIISNLNQKELARKAGIKEQQIQRYEADRYKSISLANYQRIANIVGLTWVMKFPTWATGGWALSDKIDIKQIKKVAKHARDAGWLDDPTAHPILDDEAGDYLQRYISDHITKYGSPSLLRTGLNIINYDEDLALLAWKARVIRRAEQKIECGVKKYNPLDVAWITDLAAMTLFDDGPVRLENLLYDKGIILVIEPGISGMQVDGASFLIGSYPVIGLTLRRDTLDNFWFTSLHELGHIILHARTGLALGFYDDVEISDTDEFESEANLFASNILVPDEKWKRSPVRASKSPEAIKKFAKEMRVDPSIVFGRIRKERGYNIFSDYVGYGTVRKMFCK